LPYADQILVLDFAISGKRLRRHPPVTRASDGAAGRDGLVVLHWSPIKVGDIRPSSALKWH
jgi:hypothetical protein